MTTAGHRPYRPGPGALSALLPLGVFAAVAGQVPRLAAGERISWSWSWIPSLGVDLSFVLDGLAGLFALIILAVGAMVLLYADAYLAGHPHKGRFYAYLHAFLLAMLGLVLSENLIVMFVFWELTTLLSFLLIGFEHESSAARRSARQALLVTGAGGLALLVGILLVGQSAGTFGWSALAASGGHLRGHALYLPILICMLAGAFTKSAQVPFHFWLPNAMTAPTPISAFLHSATMVKAGLYLLARLHPVLGGTAVWMATLVLVGAATAVWGAVMAFGHRDMKAVLAQTTVMALGVVTMFLGGRTTPALTAAITFLLVHALYKSALFLVVGGIDHQTGTRRLDEVGGIGRRMPLTAAAALMAAFSMAGFPLFLGFVGKEIMYKGALTEDMFPGLATAAALTANALMTAAAAVLALRPFWGPGRRARAAAEVPWPMWIGPLLLGGTGLGFGLIPDWVGRWLIEPAVGAVQPDPEQIRLKLFYGFNEPLLLSILTLSLGAALYWRRRALRAAVAGLQKRLPLTAERVYEGLLHALARIAEGQTRILQNGSLFRYLVVILTAVGLTVGTALLTSGARLLPRSVSGPEPWLAVLIAVMLAAVAAVLRSRSRLVSVCALGIVGAGIAVIFLSFGAPDVALTQLLVETLTLIFVAIVLLRLPAVAVDGPEGGARRAVRLAVSAGGGLLAAGLLAAVCRFEVDRSVVAFYEQLSYVEAHGRNIVNVILVDFRSLDTLGEIIVVAASALASLMLIRGARSRE